MRLRLAARSLRPAADGPLLVVAHPRFAYLAAPRRVLQARDTALVIADRSISVVRRRSDRRAAFGYGAAALAVNNPTGQGVRPSAGPDSVWVRMGNDSSPDFDHPFNVFVIC